MSAGVLRGLQNRSGVFGRRVGSIPTHSRQAICKFRDQARIHCQIVDRGFVEFSRGFWPAFGGIHISLSPGLSFDPFDRRSPVGHIQFFRDIAVP